MVEGTLIVEKLVLTEGDKARSFDWKVTATPGTPAVRKASSEQRPSHS
jgi:hypothetical protein